MAASIASRISIIPKTGCRYLRSAAPHVVHSSKPDDTNEPTTSCISDDMPISDLPNPYEKERRLCILCKYPVKLDYKNPKLLSQFVSQFTGQVYGKHITGLCAEQQKRVEKTVSQSRSAGYMPFEYKDIRYLKDPKLFDSSNQPIKKY